MRTRVGIAFVVAALALGGTLVGAAPAGAAALHTVAVTPSTGLSDGQTVTVSGTGFVETPIINDWAVGLCSAAILSDGITLQNALHDCDVTTEPFTFTHADADGNLTSPFVVRKTFSTSGGTVSCGQAPNDCAILVSQLTGQEIVGAAAPISFGPTVKKVTVTPSTGLADGQTVTVTGTGYVETPQVNGWGVVMCDPTVLARIDLLTALQHCDITQQTFVFVNADAAGKVSTPYTLRKSFTTSSGTVTCGQAPNDCAILVAQVTDSGFVGAASPISFGPPVKTVSQCFREFAHDHQHRLRYRLIHLLGCVFTALTHHATS